jgi:CobQ-like glutamine amidotransferase family enzyme
MRSSGSPKTSDLTVVVVHPDLLGTYGDGGNGLVLARRAAWRGLTVELVDATSDRPLPRLGQIYCLGGGEDGPQARSAEALAADGGLVHSVEQGAVVLAVCAGFQIVGEKFPSADGRLLDGLGLLDVTTTKGTGPRAVGELVTDPVPGLDGVPTLTGFENHGGTTVLGAGTGPLGQVLHGVGNGVSPGSAPGRVDQIGRCDGAWTGRVIGTYLHGPLLARNPVLADRLLVWATGGLDPLDPLDDAEEDALRSERFHAVGQQALPRGGGRLRRWRRR